MKRTIHFSTVLGREGKFDPSQARNITIFNEEREGKEPLRLDKEAASQEPGSPAARCARRGDASLLRVPRVARAQPTRDRVPESEALRADTRRQHANPRGDS
jgi:hypothetical protein